MVAGVDLGVEVVEVLGGVIVNPPWVVTVPHRGSTVMVALAICSSSHALNFWPPTRWRNARTVFDAVGAVSVSTRMM